MWKIETKYQCPYANPSCYMSSTNDAYCLVTSIMFPNYEDVNESKGCMYCCTNQPLKICIHPLWIHSFFKDYILGPKMLGTRQGSTPRDTWDFLNTNSPL